MSALSELVAVGPMVYSAIPTAKAQDVIYVKGIGMMEWVEITGTGAFTGYRTLRCGSIEFGTAAAPRSYEADLVGGLGSKVTQASIWAWAQQQGHTVAAASWSTKVFKFADVDSATFRFPDLRDQFVRFTGTNADNGNERTIGSQQADAFRSHTHTGGSTSPIGSYTEGGVNMGNYTTTGATGGPETRPTNTAFKPRIHI
jgi:hypothetical protein